VQGGGASEDSYQGPSTGTPRGSGARVQGQGLGQAWVTLLPCPCPYPCPYPCRPAPGAPLAPTLSKSRAAAEALGVTESTVTSWLWTLRKIE